MRAVFGWIPGAAAITFSGMLESLHVKNLAIVENSRVTFETGLNVITGETGAGKSILIGALDLILGGRADKGMIRAGETECRIEAVFQLADPAPVNALLAELGMDDCLGGTLIVRRTIATGGSGKNIVNDCATTVQALKLLGNLLVDMHGPHDHQSLLHQDAQLEVLDAFAHADRAPYEAAYRQWLDLLAQRKELDADEASVAAQLDMLSYQVKEIEDAELDDADEEEVAREHAEVANAQRIGELADQLDQALTGDDGSAFTALVACQHALAELARIIPAAQEWMDEARSISVQIQELSMTVGGYAQNLEADPDRLQWLEDRLALLRKLMRKYGGSLPAVREFLREARGRLHALETRHERLAELDASIAAARNAVESTGKALTALRRKGAGALAKRITAELRDLGFAHGGFDVSLAEAEPGPAGMDVVDFGFMPNVGEPMRPLRAIASSGEISRVMLATKAVLAEHDRIPLLVFDEIDANVGGEIGNAVGAKLAAVADNRQVICITHLPQVAVQGATHFVVKKSVNDGRTHTQIQRLDDNDRPEEVARMLGGRDLTSVTLKHAREMLRKRR